MHYAGQHAAKVAGSLSGGPNYQPGVEMNDHAANNYNDPSHPNEFRARFHRSLVAPSPFRTFTDTQTATTSTPTSSGGSGPPSDPIDPHLTGAAAAANGTASTNGTGAGTSESRTKHASSNLDPDFGQARGEAEGVVVRLERGMK
jgi:hypothetical protein